jgi:hypothetical protein
LDKVGLWAFLLKTVPSSKKFRSMFIGGVAMISRYGRGLIAWRGIKTKFDYIRVGFLSLAMTFGSCISIKAGSSYR